MTNHYNTNIHLVTHTVYNLAVPNIHYIDTLREGAVEGRNAKIEGHFLLAHTLTDASSAPPKTTCLRDVGRLTVTCATEG